MGSVGSERKRLHRDLFERGVASDNCGDDGDNDDDFSCRTDLTTVQASNVRRDTVRSAPNVAIDGESPGRAAATIQFFEYVSYYISSHTAANGMFVYPVSRNSRPDQHTRGIGCPSSPQRSPSSTLCHTKFGLWGT
jgi:hypothetical protein